MKKILAFILLSSTFIVAQSAGSSGLSFLKIGFGARNIAMGDLGVVSANDVTALNYNPALLSDYSGSQLLFTHNSWIQDVRSEMIGASFKLFSIPFAVGVNTTSISDIEIRERPGESQSNFDAHYFAGSISTGFYVIDNLSFGTTIKYLYEGILTDESTGWAFDFGLHYKAVIEGLNIGASIKNIGSMNNLRNKASELPVDLRFGASYNFLLEKLKSDVTIIAGYQKYTSTEDNHLHLGLEIFYGELIALRGGYMTGYDSKGFTAGVGILWKDINFDYAFTPFSFNLGSAHTISVQYSF